MKTNCLDIGIIQSFLDGELSGVEVTRVSDHIGDCDTCAMLVSRAEDENAIVFPALAREFDAMVPTQRLWARIEDSIEIEKASAPWLQKALALIVTNFISPQIGALAALLIVVGLFAMYKFSGPSASNDVAGVMPKAAPVTREIVPVTTRPADIESNVPTPTRASRSVVENASYRMAAKTAAPQIDTKDPQPVVQDAAYLPGEQSYVKTIASLKKTVTGDQDPNVMSASQQVSYARDMAVVDNTITRMRDAIKKNPKDETAKQMLSSAYQSKIDLLNSIAQKEELVASLR